MYSQPVYPRMLKPQMQRADCTIAFHIRDMSMLRVLVFMGILEPPADTKGCLCAPSIVLPTRDRSLL